VYEGNIHAGAGDTRCPGCDALLIRRDWHRVLVNRLREGACPECGQRIPGRWESNSIPGASPSGIRARTAKYDSLNL
jgi:hypothetical protein